METADLQAAQLIRGGVNETCSPQLTAALFPLYAIINPTAWDVNGNICTRLASPDANRFLKDNNKTDRACAAGSSQRVTTDVNSTAIW